MVLELVVIAVSDGIVVKKSHQEKLGALASLTEGRQISPSGACNSTEKKKPKVKTREATEFSKMLRARIILKLKNLGAKIL